MFYHYDSLFRCDLLPSLADEGGLINTLMRTITEPIPI